MPRQRLGFRQFGQDEWDFGVDIGDFYTPDYSPGGDLSDPSLFQPGIDISAGSPFEAGGGAPGTLPGYQPTVTTVTTPTTEKSLFDQLVGPISSLLSQGLNILGKSSGTPSTIKPGTTTTPSLSSLLSGQGVSIAGMNLSLPVLALIGVGVFLVMKGGPKGIKGTYKKNPYQRQRRTTRRRR